LRRKTDAGLQIQGSSFKDPKDPRFKTQELLAETGEPPVVVPAIVVAADVHVALVEPAVERGVTPVSIGILPVGTVGVLVGKSGVIGIGLDKLVRIRRLVYLGLEPGF
jgi:hypothetical protein